MYAIRSYYVPMVNDREKFCLPSLSYGQCSSVAELGLSFAWEQSLRIENRITSYNVCYTKLLRGSSKAMNS